MGRRVPRLNEQLRREVAETLARQVRDPRVLGVTVTGARASPDLDLARIYVRLSSQPEEHDRQLEGLEASAAFIRGVLSRRLRLRRVPELRFVPDHTQESAARIEELLRSVRPPAPDGPMPESGEPDAEDPGSSSDDPMSDGSASAGPDGPEDDRP